MTELITVIVIVGILAVSVLPRFNAVDYRAAQYHDQVRAALRYAQKVATSHRRMVCATFTASTLSLTIDSARGNAACPVGNSLLVPGRNINTLASPDTANVLFSPIPATLYFRPDGRITVDAAGLTAITTSLAITGASDSIRIVGDTGLVY